MWMSTQILAAAGPGTKTWPLAAAQNQMASDGRVGTTHQPVPHHLHLYRSASLHRTWTSPFLSLPYPSMHLLTIMAPNTATASRPLAFSCLPRPNYPGQHACQLLNLFSFYICAWLFCLDACRCTMWMPGAHGGKKGALEPLGLKLQKCVGHYMGPGNWTLSLWKTSKCSNN